MLIVITTIFIGKINRNISTTDIASIGTLSNLGYITVLIMINETIRLNIKAI